jgi:PTH1 family peptidyl-tRNA hydrolase
MLILVGLGNPGEQYSRNRHNIGFILLDYIASEFKADFHLNSKLYAETALIDIEGQKILLVKPQTFMNLSGQSVKKVLEYHNASTQDLRIIYDDKDIPLGNIRLRKEGSAAGHNGVKDIIAHLGTNEFWRVRIGIGRELMRDTKRYVLANFTNLELNPIKKNFDTAWKDIISTELKETTFTSLEK